MARGGATHRVMDEPGHGPHDDDDPEARLHRQILIRRVVMGVGGIAIGIAMMLLGAAFLWLTFAGHGGRRGTIRIGAVALVAGVVLAIAGWTTLRRGEIDLDTGKVTQGQAPVPMRMIVIASSIVAGASAALVAWPLGLYEWIGTLDSGCRSFVTAAEMSELAGQELVLASVADQSGDLHCHAVFESAGGSPVAEVEIGGDLGGGQFENHLAFIARGARRETIEGVGEEAWSITASGVSTIAIRSGHAGAFVRWQGGEAASRERAITIVRARLGLLEPYSARWIERHGPR